MFARINQTQALLDTCVQQSEHNTCAIKMVLDAQMIDHLIQRQDVEDRKRLLMLGPSDKLPVSGRAGKASRRA